MNGIKKYQLQHILQKYNFNKNQEVYNVFKNIFSKQRLSKMPKVPEQLLPLLHFQLKVSA